jgi:hypothetical protein
MSPGFVWRTTLRSVLIHPRDSSPVTLDRRSLPVVAALDRARPHATEESQLVAAMGWTSHNQPPNADQWMDELLRLLESVGLVSFSITPPGDAAEAGHH